MESNKQELLDKFFKLAAVKVSFSKSILADMNIIQIPFEAYESYYLSDRSGKRIDGLDFAGFAVARDVSMLLARNLMDIAKNPVSQVPSGCTWFISEADWNTANLNRFGEKYGFDRHSCIHIRVFGNESFIVEKETIELVLHKWTFLPWSEGKHPVVVYGFTDFSEITSGVSSVYYKINLLKSSGVQLL